MKNWKNKDLKYLFIETWALVFVQWQTGISVLLTASFKKTLLDILTRLLRWHNIHHKIISALKYWECTKVKRTKVGIGGEWHRGRRDEDRDIF